VQNIKHQVEMSGYDKNQLIGGIILTGGAANLKGMELVVSELLGIEKLRVAKNARVTVRGERIDNVSLEIFATALALFEQADVNCCGGELGEGTPDLFFGTQQPEQPEQLVEEELVEVEETPEPQGEDTTPDDEEPEEKPKKKGGFKKMFFGALTKVKELLDEE
jgi:cell division protein FtsA